MGRDPIFGQSWLHGPREGVVTQNRRPDLRLGWWVTTPLGNHPPELGLGWWVVTPMWDPASLNSRRLDCTGVAVASESLSDVAPDGAGRGGVL